MHRAVLARAAHDLGLAAWFGGALMGAVALNAATREVDDHTQRLRVADAGWFRWGPPTALAVVAHLGGAAVRGRLRHHRGGALVRQRQLLTAAALAATAETGRLGRRVMMAGDVPAATAVEPISDTPPGVAAAQHRLRVMQWVVPALTAGLWLVDALQDDRHRPHLLTRSGRRRAWMHRHAGAADRRGRRDIPRSTVTGRGPNMRWVRKVAR